MIHYHGTPCSGTRIDAARFLRGRHAFVSWLRDENIGTAAEVCQTFAIDNGAFTAWKQGEPISDWRPFFDYVELWRWHPGFSFAIIPDVIDGNERDNDELLREWQFHFPSMQGVPVWHFHESLERLQRLCRTFPRVALGSSGDWPNPGTERWWERAAEAMRYACDEHGRPFCKLHGLRMLDPAIFHRLPLASADSTNAARNSSSLRRFGMYQPPDSAGRMATIADRIEAHQSAAIWVPRDEQAVLAFG